MDHCGDGKTPLSGELSIFGLLTRLSEILVKEDNPALSGKKLSYVVNKARSSLYGTLLGKYHNEEISALSEKLDHMNPLSWLIAERFILSNADKEEASLDLDDTIKELFKLGWDDAPHPILRTLISLAHSSASSSCYEDLKSQEPFSLSKKIGLIVPQRGSFKLAPAKQLYPVLSPEIFKPPVWMNIDHSTSQQGGYVTSFPFNRKPGEGLPLLLMFGGESAERLIPAVPSYHLQSIPALTGPRDLNLPSTISQSNYEDEGYFTPVTEVAAQSHIASDCDFKDPTKIWSEALHTPLPRLKSWETYGKLITEAEPPVLSSAGPKAIHHLSIFVNTYQDIFKTQNICDPIPTLRQDFVRDVLLLLTGIGSINFLFAEESDCFSLRKGVWLEGYSAEDTALLCQDFLFCGTYFKRLERLYHSSNEMKDHGLMIHSLLECVHRWTQFYRGAVLILSSHFQLQGPTAPLYELLEYVQTLKQQVDCLSKLCCVDRPSENATLPSGVALLAHIYREASKSNNQQSHLLYSALKSCCEVYLQCLQRWIFLGDCSNEKANEFFVWKDPVFSAKQDRSFWVRGFILNKSSVPVFLQGLEVAVFDCGRAMNLLQLCSPQHPLCMLLDKRHPTIRCCLYKSDMEKMQRECAQFEQEAQMVCGDFTNVSKLLDKEKEQETQLQILVQNTLKEKEILRASVKAQHEKERAVIKERQNAALKAQILEVQQRRAAEKEQQRIEDELYLLECQRRDEAAKIMEDEQRLKVIAHYEELGKIVDKQNQLREWQMKRLKMSDKRQTFLYEDSLKLAKDTQQLGKITAFIPSFSETNESVLMDHDNDHPMISQAYEVLPPTSTSNVVVQNEPEAEEFPKAVDTFKEAATIKAKVQRIEFGEDSTCEVTHFQEKPDSITENEKIESPAISSSSRPHTLNLESHSSIGKESDSGKADTLNDLMTFSDTDVSTALIRNRQKVMTAHDCWKAHQSIEKKASEDSGIISDLDRNRQRVLGENYNIITGMRNALANDGEFEKQSELQRHKGNVSSLSDLQRNKRRVLGEEYNILTGELCRSATNSVSTVSADSGVVISSSASNDSLMSKSAEKKNKNITFCEASVVISEPEAERPRILSDNGETSNLISPLTPHGYVGMPVFTSPFKGTNHLPNELPLASPLVDSVSEKITCFEVNGIPLMIDIADNFSLKFSPPVLDSTDTVDQSETSKPLPNTSWLESSLQTCLLLPLRLQYNYVSAALLHFFLVDLDLLSHLKSLRSYFLMQDGEFGRHLTVKLFTQMYQVSSPAKLLNSSTLDKVVREALASSRSIADPNHNRLSLDASSVPDHFSHSSPNVLDCIQLSYKIKWPLNLLFTSDVLEKYNLIFVFLIRWKRVAWLLQEDFVALKNTARGCFKEQNRDLLNSPQYHQVQMIRHSMSQFVQATLNYVSSCVLHASWTDFASSLKQATTIDHIYNAHIEYIKRLLKRCLLNNNSKRVEAVLNKILLCIIKFHSNLRVRPWQVPNQNHSMSSPCVYLEHPNFQQLSACSTHFKLLVSKLVSYLERLISPSHQQQHLAEYLLLLNINGFFKASDYLKHAEKVNSSDGRSFVSSQSTSRAHLMDPS